MSASNGMRPVHPGEILGEELETIGISASALTKALAVGQKIAERVQPREAVREAV